MSSKCTITFNNNPLSVYYAGQMVSGTAELITNRPKTIRSILITISGFAEVRWTENIVKQDTHGERKNTIETYSSSEIYYSNENCVYGQSGGSQIELPAGKYVFPFQGTIPPNAPTSFNGSWGQVQHEVTVTIDRVMRYNNIFKQAYTVLAPYDLNLNPNHAQPLHKLDEKTICWSLCCGSQGPLVMTVNVPYSAYAPGQKVFFNIILDNQLDMNCSDVKVRLMKKVVYTSQSPETKTKTTELKVADNHCGDVLKLNKAEFNEYLQIPSTTPSSLESCKIIQVSYTLKFIAKISRIYGDLIIEFPLTIGTVPIYASMYNNLHESGAAITNQPGLTNIYKPLAPPHYEEDVRNEQFESNTFKPRYPIFLNDPKLMVDNVSPNVVPSAAAVTPMPMPASIPSAPTPTPTANNGLYPKPQIDTVALPSAPIMEMSTTASPTSNSTTLSTTTTTTTINPTTKITSNQPQKAAINAQPSLEVLGFSIPPDYEPTPNELNA